MIVKAHMSEEAQPDPLQVLRTLMAYWRTIAICAGVAFVLALVVAFVSPPAYRSETLLSYNDDELNDPGLAALASQFAGVSSIAGLSFGNSGSQKDVALALLTARGFLEDFLAENNLLPVLFADRWDAEGRKWRSRWWSMDPTVADGVRFFLERVLTVTEDRRTGLVRLTVTWTDPERAADWANDLVRRANEVTRDWAIGEARESREYLRAQLDQTNVLEVRESVNRLIENELKKEMIASVRVQFSFRVIDDAKPSDLDDYVRPRRLLLSAFGLFVGLGIGVILALAINYVRSHPIRR